MLPAGRTVSNYHKGLDCRIRMLIDRLARLGDSANLSILEPECGRQPTGGDDTVWVSHLIFVRG